MRVCGKRTTVQRRAFFAFLPRFPAIVTKVEPFLTHFNFLQSFPQKRLYHDYSVSIAFQSLLSKFSGCLQIVQRIHLNFLRFQLNTRRSARCEKQNRGFLFEQINFYPNIDVQSCDAGQNLVATKCSHNTCYCQINWVTPKTMQRVCM